MFWNLNHKDTNHRFARQICFGALILLAYGVLCSADRIILKEGQIITGDILTEKKDQVYIDIGITVVVVPKDKILEYEYSETLTVDDADIGQISGSSKEQDNKLYKTASLGRTTI